MSCYKRWRTKSLPDGSKQRVQDRHYTISLDHAGKQHARLTNATTREEAERHERALRAELRAGNWQILHQIRLRRAPADLTFAQLFALYRAHAPALREIKEKTIELNIHALQNILRAAGAVPADQPSDPESAWAQTLHLLTGPLVNQYKTAILTAAQALDPEDAQARYRSANSLLLQARSLFTPDLQQAYKDVGHNLPATLPEFLSRPAFARVQKTEYHPAPDTLIAKTFAAVPDLEKTDPPAFIAYWLTIGFGLRKSEIGDAAPDWFLELDGDPAIDLRKVTKNNRFGETLRCQLDAWPRLQPHVDAARAAHRAHLLTGTTTERTEDTFRRVNAWLRGLGWNTQKGIHELRAWAGCQVANGDPRGLLAARDFLRHAQYSTTDKFYGRYIRTKSKPVPLQLPTIAPLAIAEAKQA